MKENFCSKTLLNIKLQTQVRKLSARSHMAENIRAVTQEAAFEIRSHLNSHAALTISQKLDTKRSFCNVTIFQ